MIYPKPLKQIQHGGPYWARLGPMSRKCGPVHPSLTSPSPSCCSADTLSECVCGPSRIRVVQARILRSTLASPRVADEQRTTTQLQGLISPQRGCWGGRRGGAGHVWAQAEENSRRCGGGEFVKWPLSAANSVMQGNVCISSKGVKASAQHYYWNFPLERNLSIYLIHSFMNFSTALVLNPVRLFNFMVL
jgi:hypothetical protein